MSDVDVNNSDERESDDYEEKCPLTGCSLRSLRVQSPGAVSDFRCYGSSVCPGDQYHWTVCNLLIQDPQ